MTKEIRNIEDSVRAKLHNKRKDAGIAFMEILRNYAMERFLYRFSQVEFADEFILKGALLFTVWEVQGRRTTLDIDLLAHYSNKITEIEKAVQEVCTVRVKFIGFLGKSRIPMQIDFGFGDTIYPPPQKINYPVILDFPSPRLKGYAPETVVSEKFEAMVQLGALNSRMKDFCIWKAFLKKGNIKHALEKLNETAKIIEKFLIKPLEAISKGEEFYEAWKAPGGWG